MLIEIPPKYVINAVVGFIKGKSAIQIARTTWEEKTFLVVFLGFMAILF